MKILYYSAWFLTRVISRSLFRINVSGREHIPQTGGFIIASNHISYVDPPLVGSWSPREVYSFAKAELFRNRLFGAVLRRINALPVKRGTIDRHALKSAVTAIQNGYGLTVFPEGTRSKGAGFLDPKPGLGIIARRSGCPIVPCYVHGANRLRACLRGRQRLSVTYGKPFSSHWVESQPETRDGYEQIVSAVMGRIAELRDTIAATTLAVKKNHSFSERTKNRQKKT